MWRTEGQTLFVFAGELDLLELTALPQSSGLYLGGDSGGLHVAWMTKGADRLPGSVVSMTWLTGDQSGITNETPSVKDHHRDLRESVPRILCFVSSNC